MSGIIAHTAKDLDLLARLMRAEAVGEGEYGMLMVGNVAANRILTNCLDFKNIKTVQEMIFQSPGGFVGSRSPLFFSSSTIKERELASRVLLGEYYYPATNSLWFYSPVANANCIGLWYDQKLAGRFKNHCFYEPYAGVCLPLH